jgi:hypothetical protein
MKITHTKGETRHAIKIAKCETYRHLHFVERDSDIETAARVAFLANAHSRCPQHEAPMKGQAVVVEWGQALGSDTI